jgi:hypothetical protein
MWVLYQVTFFEDKQLSPDEVFPLFSSSLNEIFTALDKKSTAHIYGRQAP